MRHHRRNKASTEAAAEVTDDTTGEMTWCTFEREEHTSTKAPKERTITLKLTEQEAWAVNVVVRGMLAGGHDPVLARVLEKLKGIA